MELMLRTLARKERGLNDLKARVASVQEQVDLLKQMIAEASGQPDPTKKQRAARSTVKRTVLSLLQQVGADGLNAGIAVDLAARTEIELQRSSVAGLLSRLKREGVVAHDGERYRLVDLGSSRNPIDTN